MPSGGAIPSGDGTWIGADIAASGAASVFVAAAVSAFRSINPESSREEAVEAGRDEGRLAATGLEAEVSALSENNTDDSLRAPVLEPPPPPRPKLAPPPWPLLPCSGALVVTSSSLPALSIPPNKSAAAPRTGRAAA